MYTKTNKQKFRSSTDVNNYNKFLLELDNKKQTPAPIFANCTANNKARDIVDPNIYVSFDPNKLAFMYEKRKQMQDLLDLKKKEEEKNAKELEKEKELANRRKVNIQATIDNIGDLLKLIEEYPDDKSIEYNINMHSLHKIKKPLLELDAMIGMQNLKENIVDQILYYIQNLHKDRSDTALHKDKKKSVCNDFLHTVIYGPPGTGKTEVAKIIGSIFANLGILLKGTFKKVTRSDLVAGFLGQTALKTRDVIKECLGGVLFIDEAYSLGNQEKRDNFSKECIDTLCEALSDHKDNLMVIIAGYETDLDECFFKYNQGLNSRFTWRLKIDNYNDVFKFYGRDIETLFAKTKISHSRRVFCLDESEKKRLSTADIDKGLEIFLKNGIKNAEDEHIKKSLSYMYS